MAIAATLATAVGADTMVANAAADDVGLANMMAGLQRIADAFGMANARAAARASASPSFGQVQAKLKAEAQPPASISIKPNQSLSDGLADNLIRPGLAKRLLRFSTAMHAPADKTHLPISTDEMANALDRGLGKATRAIQSRVISEVVNGKSLDDALDDYRILLVTQRHVSREMIRDAVANQAADTHLFLADAIDLPVPLTAQGASEFPIARVPISNFSEFPLAHNPIRNFAENMQRLLCTHLEALDGAKLPPNDHAVLRDDD